MENNRILELLKKKGPVTDWFYKNIVKRVKQITYPENPYIVFYINKDTDKFYMLYNKKNGILLVDYDKIWLYFESNYSNNYMEIQQLIKNMMLKHYNLWNIRPDWLMPKFIARILEHYNLWTVTPFILQEILLFKVLKHYTLWD